MCRVDFGWSGTLLADGMVLRRDSMPKFSKRDVSNFDSLFHLSIKMTREEWTSAVITSFKSL